MELVDSRHRGDSRSIDTRASVASPLFLRIDLVCAIVSRRVAAFIFSCASRIVQILLSNHYVHPSLGEFLRERRSISVNLCDLTSAS